VIASAAVAVGVTAVVVGAAAHAHSQASGRFPLFENNQIKVWKSVIQPGAPLAMHRHDHPRVLIILAGGTIDLVQQNGPTERHIWETGKAYWFEPTPPNTMHADVNAGSKPIELIAVELEGQQH
jgi:quercetin dioxygenase-like cupin family protein